MITWAGCFFFSFPRCSVQPVPQHTSHSPPPPFSFYLLPSTTIHCSLCLVSFILREWCRNLFHSLSYLPDALQFGLKFFRLRSFFPSAPFAEKCSSWITSPTTTRETLWRIAEHSKSPPKRSSEWEACSSGRFHRWRRVLATATVPAARKPINTSIITRLRQQRLSSRRRHRRRPTRIKLAIRGLI